MGGGRFSPSPSPADRLSRRTVLVVVVVVVGRRGGGRAGLRTPSVGFVLSVDCKDGGRPGELEPNICNHEHNKIYIVSFSNRPPQRAFFDIILMIVIKEEV
jgi:hypothetical protein